jgi:hypothetical protein
MFAIDTRGQFALEEPNFIVDAVVAGRTPEYQGEVC